MAYIYDLSDAWSASGTTFTGIKLNVTDTASASTSLLMDLQVGGVSRFSVGKTGTLFTGGGEVSTNPAISMNQGRLYTDFSGYRLIYSVLNSPLFAVNGGYGLVLPSTTPFAFSSTTSATGAGDVFLYRDGVAGILAQRNGVNAQAFNLYNTYTDASNYERGFMRFVSNVLEIGSAAAGTGTQRQTKLVGASFQFDVGATSVFAIQSTGNLIFNNTNSRDIGVAGGVARTVRVGTSIENAGYDEFTEMTAPAAPATNGVRIYAEDNGSGKTRIMARFATGAAVQIAIEP